MDSEAEEGAHQASAVVLEGQDGGLLGTVEALAEEVVTAQEAAHHEEAMEEEGIGLAIMQAHRTKCLVSAWLLFLVMKFCREASKQKLTLRLLHKPYKIRIPRLKNC